MYTNMKVMLIIAINDQQCAWLNGKINISGLIISIYLGLIQFH